MHTYLDGDLSKEEESHLLNHLQGCEKCQQHFHELKRTITSIQHAQQIESPPDFTDNVIANLPKEKRTEKYGRLLRGHPVIAAVAIFLIFYSAVYFQCGTKSGN